MNIAVIGNQGDLAVALTTSLQQDHLVTNYSKNEFNFLNKQSVIDLAERISSADVIICCAGVFSEHDSWDSYTINTVAPLFLLDRLTQLSSKAHFIMVGSHAAMWTSWPGINFARLVYNTSKQSIQSIVVGLAQSGQSSLTLTVINPSSFQSKMNNYQGYPIDQVVESVHSIITSSVPLLVVEYNNFK